MQSPKIAACMIVKDAETIIEQALTEIRPFVDGVFIYDTGSTDGTLGVLERLNQLTDRTVRPEDGSEPVVQPLAPIVVEQGEWREDFSWARQQSWEMPDESYDWLLWLDDDDIVVGAHNLRYLAASAAPEIDGFVVYYDYARDAAGNCVCQLWRERLLRRSAGYVWTNPIHEVLIPPDGRTPALATLPANTLRYIHARPENRYGPDRNLTILLAEAERETAEHGSPLPRTLAYLGTENMARGRFDVAAPYLEEYLSHTQADWSDERSQVRHKLATCLRVLAAPQAAVHVEFEALKERDDWTENYVGLAGSFAELGQWARAELWAQRALEKGMPQSPLILNPLEHSLLPLLIIADARMNQQNYDGARDAVRQALEVAPLPEVHAKMEEIARQSNAAEIIGAVLMLREVLVRHDENLKAWTLMQSVPYLVEDAPLIVHARAAQRENVMHALKPEEYRRWYEDEPKESTIEDEHVENVGDFIERARFTLENLQEMEAKLGRKPRVLDLGGNDMWVACYLWRKGEYVVDGIELNKASVEKGHERMERFGAPGKLVQGDIHDALWLLGGGELEREHTFTEDGIDEGRWIAKNAYDAVLMYEVFEHVPDTERTLDVMEQLVAEDGLIMLTTPNGAFERGMIDRWSAVERKGHLRALPAHQFAEQLMRRGVLEDFRVHHGGRLTFAAYRPQAPKSSIVFYAGGSFESWSPAQIKGEDDEGRVGLGGSETALVQVATRLAKRGHLVTVYSGSDEGVFGGVLYRPFTAWDPTRECDLLVVSRLPHVFDNPLGAKRTALWCHDHSYPGLLTEERVEKIDDILVLSEWQRERFERLYPFAEDKLVLMRNGISYFDLEDGETPRYADGVQAFSKRKPRVVYSSSADRGLDVLLDMWPRIREKAPKAELHVYYGFDVLERVAFANHDPNLLAYRRAILDKVNELGGEEGGIFMRGRVGQEQLAQDMMQARVLGYPTAFLETSCITAMEARAAGLAIVTSDLGALGETVGEHGVLIPWSDDETAPHNQSDEYQDAFITALCAALTDAKEWGRLHRLAVEEAQENDWEARIDEWELLVPALEEVTAQ